MLKPRQLHHAAVRVTDVARARDFYENLLGLKPLPRPEFSFGGAWYGLGDNQLHLIASEKRKGIDPLSPHVAFEVEDFEATKQQLRKLGVEFLEGDFPGTGRQLWILDPDGNTVELRMSDPA